MSLEARNRIVPQMSDYDKIGDQWVPYLMRADGASKSFKSVSTDEWGFRHSVGRDGGVLSVERLKNLSGEERIGVIVGSSAVFGVGSSQDRYTIPSYLNFETDTQWFNFGGRAYNSTQELIKFILHFPGKIDRLIFFSGVNNITLSFLSPSTSPVYNSFFSQTVFQRAMSNPPDDYIGVRRAFMRLMKELRHRFVSEDQVIARVAIDSTYDDILSCFERDIRVIKSLATGMGVSLYFALQPLATWLDKSLSKEESEIFKILDGMSMDWQVLSRYIGGVKDRYFVDVSEICKRHSVRYCNINHAPEFMSDEWLFVDRVHLTDRGCALAAQILKREFNL